VGELRWKDLEQIAMAAAAGLGDPAAVAESAEPVALAASERADLKENFQGRKGVGLSWVLAAGMAERG
jgi:hypothetical protein